MKPGTIYDFPVQTLNSKATSTRAVAAYADKVYGLTEAGGTQNLMQSGVSFELLGFNPDAEAEAFSFKKPKKKPEEVFVPKKTVKKKPGVKPPKKLRVGKQQPRKKTSKKK